MSELLRKKKIFISQPMRGINDGFVLEERKNIKEKVEKLLDEEVDLIDTFTKNDPPENAGSLWYLGDSISLLDQADILVAADTGTHRFIDANGCLIEYCCARIYGKEIIALTQIPVEYGKGNQMLFRRKLTELICNTYNFQLP